MGNLMTGINVPGARLGWGIADWGDRTAAEMISLYRAYAAELRAKVEAIEACADEDFLIEVYRGPIVRHHVRWVQNPSPAPVQS